MIECKKKKKKMIGGGEIEKNRKNFCPVLVTNSINSVVEFRSETEFNRQ